MEKFAERLKELRAEAGLTQSELAGIINTTDDSIYSWEKGRSEPSLGVLCSLSKALGVSSDYLLGLTDEY